MALSDKLKAQASQIAGKAQEAGRAGQAKIEALQAKRRADDLLQELGGIDYRARQSGGKPGDEQRALDIVEQLKQFEAEFGSVEE